MTPVVGQTVDYPSTVEFVLTRGRVVTLPVILVALVVAVTDTHATLQVVDLERYPGTTELVVALPLPEGEPS